MDKKNIHLNVNYDGTAFCLAANAPQLILKEGNNKPSQNGKKPEKNKLSPTTPGSGDKQQQRRPMSPSQNDVNTQSNGGLAAAQNLQQYQVDRWLSCYAITRALI